LKNPLTPIRFAISRLRREAPESLRETIDVLETESQRLDEMARSFAQFGRLPEGPQAPVDLVELVRACTRSAVPEGIPITIQVDDDVPMVPGHAEALGRALTNVLLNAVEAAPEGSPIVVAVRRSHARRGGHEMVEIVVSDKGAGIPASKLDRIWEPYVTHKAGGTGLGLAIVRQTVYAHGGTTSAESTPGQGTMITLALPVEAANDAAMSAPAGSEG